MFQRGLGDTGLPVARLEAAASTSAGISSTLHCGIDHCYFICSCSFKEPLGEAL